MPAKPATSSQPRGTTSSGTSLVPREMGPAQGLSTSKVEDVSVLSLFNSNSSVLQLRNRTQGK